MTRKPGKPRDKKGRRGTAVDPALVARMLGAGMQEHQSGNLPRAEKLYRSVLDLAPDHAEALHLLGVIAFTRGQYEKAVRLLRRAVARHPSQAHYFINLGNALDKAGERDAAVESYRRAVALDSDNAELHSNLGNTLYGYQRVDEAVEEYRQALALAPASADVHNNLGAGLKAQGKMSEAEQHLREALRLKPDFALAHNNLGRLLADRGRVSEALEHLRHAERLMPDADKVHVNLAWLSAEAGDFPGALEQFQRALKGNPSLEQTKRWSLAFKSEGELDASELRDMEHLLARGKLSDAERASLEHVLGLVYDKLGQYERAFAHMSAGNRLKTSTYPFDRAAFESQITALIEIYSAEFFAERKDYGAPDVAPIFILGMPRSGTTLVESIISAHPAVYGAGELSFFGELAEKLTAVRSSGLSYPQCALDLTAADCTRHAADYLDHLRSLAGNGSRVTDKMPHNFLHLGLIRLLFPKARVIHCRRSAMDTCLSIFFQDFSPFHAYSFELADLGWYYRQYERLMGHWRTVLPGGFLEIDYENLVAEPERLARLMIEHCGLEWDDRCLTHRREMRQVKTASITQVRQPIYRGSVERWRRYAPWLGPLTVALEIRDEDADKPLPKEMRTT